MNAVDHCFPALVPMQSLYSFVVKDLALVSKEIHGEMRTTPRRREERWTGEMETVLEGWG